MKKVLVLMVVALSLVGMTNAQSGKMKLGVGAIVSLPMGTFGDVASIGFGGIVQGEYAIDNQLVGTLRTGYVMYSGKDVPFLSGNMKSDYSLIPIMVGAKYFFSPGFYGTAEIGFNMLSKKVTTPSYTYFGFTVPGSEVTASSTEFGYNIGVGYDLGNLDFVAKLGAFGSGTTNVSIQALYKFPLN